MIRCIAVDDEPKALEIITIHTNKIPDIELVATYTDPSDALKHLKNNYIDLLFLDINMPAISGLELAGQLHYKPFIVFTTAYSEYAIESYEIEAIDYLLKPIEFDRLNKAVEKVKKQVQLNRLQQDSLLGRNLFVKDGYKQIKVDIDTIRYIQSEGNYISIHTENEKVMARMTFNALLEKLPLNLFFRVHNSYVINLNHIQKIEDNHIYMYEKKIPIGVRYKEGILNYINQNC